jgi:hypothetical protein
MRPFSAAAVYAIGRAFEEMRSNFNLFERLGIVKLKSADQMESIELLPTRTKQDMTANWQKSILRVLTLVEQNFQELGLKMAAQAARDYLTELESGRMKTYTDASAAVITLDKIITLELRENLFMSVPADRAAFYAKPQLFGEAVNKRFSGCQYDIEEAGSCYAAGRGTACAFHLMRVMEIAVQEFGAALGIAFTTEKNWQNILDEINKAIKSLPAKDSRTIALSQAAGHLYNVKVAWRNPTMHPRITYTLEETADLISAVKAFMTELAQVI